MLEITVQHSQDFALLVHLGQSRYNAARAGLKKKKINKIDQQQNMKYLFTPMCYWSLEEQSHMPWRRHRRTHKPGKPLS